MKRISIDLSDEVEAIIVRDGLDNFRNRKAMIEFIITDYATKILIS